MTPIRLPAPTALLTILATALALATILAACGEDAAPVAGGPVDLAAGKALYVQHCASCHGTDLEGQANWRERKADGTLPAPPHDATGHTWHHPDPVLFAYIKQGGQKLVGGDFKSGMPGYDGILTDNQIRQVLDYIKSQWPEEIRTRQAEMSKKAGGG